MSRLRWGSGIVFRKLVLEPDWEDRRCASCGEFTHIYEHRDRRLYLLTGATHMVSKIAHCMDKECAGHQDVVESAAEMSVAPPFWTIGWDVFAWMGHLLTITAERGEVTSRSDQRSARGMVTR
jgi:hypothetical protein